MAWQFTRTSDRFRWAAIAVLVLLCALARADDDAWARRLALYAHDVAQPLAAREDPVKDNGAYTSQVVHLASVNNEVVPALVCRPKNVDKPPVILYLHGLGGDKSGTQMLEAVFAPLGIATVGIDAQYHGERKRKGVEIISPDLERTREAMIQTVIDNERAIDYIRSRADLDGTRVGLLGVSMGAILGTTVTAVDARVGSACLVVGGGRWDLILGRSAHPVAQFLKDRGVTTGRIAERMGDVDPINFVAHIAPRPLLMINGKADPIIPKAATEALYDAAQQPKEIVWLEGGHVPPIPELLKVVVNWAKTQVVGERAMQ